MQLNAMAAGVLLCLEFSRGLVSGLFFRLFGGDE
jgi:hypothetical protein